MHQTMRQMSRRLLAPLALALAALLPSASSAQPAAEATAGPYTPQVPRFEYGPCAVDVSQIARRIDCGVLIVAENRDRPDGRTVVMPVAIARATVADPKPDPVIFLHGGPGGGLIANLPGLFRDGALPPYVTADRDWIFFDQRGTGLGQPNLDCGEVQLTDSGLVSDADVLAMAACHQRLAAAGIDLSRYNAQEIAGDIQDMRRALAFDRFNLFGVSYGSRVAFAVQRFAPQGLRAAVHDAPYPSEARGTELLPVLVAREVRQVLALCDADPACAARHGGLEPRLTAAAAAWAAGPRVVDGQTYTVEDLASWLLDATYSWAGTRALSRDLEAVLGGDMRPLAAYMEDRSSYQEGQNLTHFCKEELPFESEAAMRAGAAGDPLAEAVVTTAARYFAACRVFPVGAPNPVEIQPVTSDVPTLLIASEIDAGCPTDFSAATLPYLPNGQFVAVPNATHGVSRRSACVRRMIARFLDDPMAPADTACIAAEHARIPFLLEPAAR